MNYIFLLWTHNYYIHSFGFGNGVLSYTVKCNITFDKFLTPAPTKFVVVRGFDITVTPSDLKSAKVLLSYHALTKNEYLWKSFKTFPEIKKNIFIQDFHFNCILWIQWYSLDTNFRGLRGWKQITNLNVKRITNFLKECMQSLVKNN